MNGAGLQELSEEQRLEMDGAELQELPEEQRLEMEGSMVNELPGNVRGVEVRGQELGRQV